MGKKDLTTLGGECLDNSAYRGERDLTTHVGERDFTAHWEEGPDNL